jgi:hypothetical protein
MRRWTMSMGLVWLTWSQLMSEVQWVEELGWGE